MRLTITIDTDNAAFGDYPEGEAARILQKLVLAVRGKSLHTLNGYALLDSNGNKVGQLTVQE